MRSFVLVWLLAAGAAGCGWRTTHLTTGSHSQVKAGSSEVASEFGIGAPLSFRFAAASNSHLLGLGGPESNVSGRVTERSTGELVNLADGTTRVLDTPATSDGRLEVLGSVGRSDDFVVIGASCVSLTSSEDEGCDGSHDPHAYSLGDDGSWSEIDLPEVDARQALGSVSFMHASGDYVVAVLRFVGPNERPVDRVVSIEGSRARDLGQIEGQPQDACTTDDAAYLLTRTTDQADILASRTSWLLTEFPRDGHPATSIELPRLSSLYGGAGVQFGCLPSGPLVASTDPGYRGFVVRLNDRKWNQVDIDMAGAGTTVISAIESGSEGAVLAVTTLPKGTAPNTTTFVAVDSGGRVRALDAANITGRTLLWAGSSGNLLALGAPTDDSTPLSLDLIEVWK